MELESSWSIGKVCGVIFDRRLNFVCEEVDMNADTLAKSGLTSKDQEELWDL